MASLLKLLQPPRKRKRKGIVVEEGDIITLKLPDGRVIYAKRIIGVGDNWIAFEDAGGQVKRERW